MKNGLVEYPNGSRKWYCNGIRHREDGPAVEHADGTRMWYRNDQLHREDGPAIEHADGTREWWFNGELHREDGPAVEYAGGTREWWINGEQHREDGPAVVYGVEHPSIKRGITHEWYFYGVHCDLANWIQRNKKLTQKQKIKLLMEYGK